MARAKDKEINNQDTRNMIRNILANDPYKSKINEKGKTHNEALKLSLPSKLFWGDKPAGFKGTKNQWKQHLDS